MGLAFFGLISDEIINQQRLNLFNELHEIAFYSQGAYEWLTVYNMPNYLRKLAFNKLKAWFKSQDSTENNPETNLVDTKQEFKQKVKEYKISPPDYIAKVSKK